MITRKVQMRAWDKFLKRFHYPVLEGYMRDGVPPVWTYEEGWEAQSCDYSQFTGSSDDNFVLQWSTGIKGKDGKEVFEGDIIKFKYSVGDFAWENMSEEETDYNQEMLGKEFTGSVQWNETLAAFEILVGEEGKTHMIFPAIYCRNSEVIGNIFSQYEK